MAQPGLVWQDFVWLSGPWCGQSIYPLKEINVCRASIISDRNFVTDLNLFAKTWDMMTCARDAVILATTRLGAKSDALTGKEAASKRSALGFEAKRA